METAQYTTATSSDQGPEMGAPKNQSLSRGKHGGMPGSLGSAKLRKQRDSRKLQRKRKKNAVVVNGTDGGGVEEDENKAEVEGKIAALKRIVPGGVELGVDKLFEETAGYILALQGQVKAMRALANLFEGLEKEKRKLGG